MPDFLKDYFDQLTTSLLSTLTTPDDYLNKIALTATIIIIGFLLHILIKKIITKSVSDYKSKYKLHRIAKSVISTLTIISSFSVWFQAINALVLIALIIGVFTVIMVRGLTSNIIGFFVIKYRKYFKIGHRIEINDIIGDVIEINSVNFKLLEARNWLSSDSNTGRIIKLPNNIIFDNSIEIIGLKNTFIWQEIKYVLSFDSNWQKAETIMTEIGHDYFTESVRHKVIENNGHLPSEEVNLHPVFSLNTNEEGIVLILRYLVDYREGTKIKTHLQRQILNIFGDNSDIKFAACDIRILQNN